MTQPDETTSLEKDAALMRAVMNGDAETAKELLRRGASARVKDKNGLTALMWAAGNGQADIVGALLKAGAEVNEKSDIGKTALMYAAQSGHAALVTGLLLAGGRSEDVCDEDERTAADLVARIGYADILQLLK